MWHRSREYRIESRLDEELVKLAVVDRCRDPLKYQIEQGGGIGQSDSWGHVSLDPCISDRRRLARA